jgi:acyl carrier protein
MMENQLNSTAAEEVGQRVRQVMGSVFGISASTLGPDASSATIAEWDSVRHLQLMLALEEEFSLQFEMDELVSLRTFAQIQERLLAVSR